MGQRLQAFIVTKDRKNNRYVHGYHLQWCWSYYTISRLYQILRYAENDCEREYSDLNNSFEFKTDEIKTLIHSLVSLNIKNNSYVYACDLNKELSDYDKSHVDGEFDSPFKFDNNDGVFIVDCTNSKPKFALFICKFDLKSNDLIFKKSSAKDYMKYYCKGSLRKNLREELEEEEVKEYMKMIKYIDSFETLTCDDINKIFKNIDKRYVIY